MKSKRKTLNTVKSQKPDHCLIDRQTIVTFTL